MDFGSTAEQQALAAKARSFADDRLRPAYQDSDREGRFRPELLGELAEQGYLALRLPHEYGGAAMSAVSTGIVLEELARADLTACYPVLNAALIGGILAANGTARQRSRWLPPIGTGESIVALCMTEAGHGTDAANVELRAERTDGGWLLKGEKTSIMLGAYATHGIVFARTGEGPGSRGVTAFYTGLDERYVTRTRLHDLGSRSGGRSTLTFDGLPVADADVVGGTGLGFAQGMRGFDYSRALIGLMAISSAQASLDEALRHAREREVFGRPLGHFQGVSFPLVEHATYLHAARLLAFEALWRNDEGLPHQVEASMAKWWGPTVAFDAAHQALLTLGHLGWSEERPLAQRLRDVLGTQLADGTGNATKLVAARAMLGREFAP